LNVDNNGFKTYSVAGTKANSQLNTQKGWTGKEKEEQQLVSDYILDAVGDITKIKPQITGPETMVAGNVLHLRTTFLYSGIEHKHWLEIAERLHPTPAVAGVPKKEAIDFIIKHERSPRGFYAGYLGPVNLDGQINLFVNLRCMQVLKKKLALHVGGGITRHSKPADEWRETKLKTNTLLGILKEKHPVLKVTKILPSLPANEHHKEGSKGIGRSLPE
jgi:isochorismate synthase